MPQNVDNFSLPGLMELSKPSVEPRIQATPEPSPFKPHAPEGALVYGNEILTYEGDVLVYQGE